MIKFNSLEELYQMTSPADLVGKLNMGFGVEAIKKSNVLGEILNILLDPTAAGARDFESIKKSIETIASKSKDENSKNQLKKLLTIISTSGIIDVLEPYSLQSPGTHLNDKAELVVNLKSVIGNKFFTEADSECVVTYILSKSPYIHPSCVGTNKVDLFINALPSIFASRMVPYMDLEFQTTRAIESLTQSPGTLKFLLGSKEPTSPGDIALANGHETGVTKDFDHEFNFSGMEMFTSPQTLTNMDMLKGSSGNRYVDVLDPFRPFATLENVTITVTPAVGLFTHKTASIQLKIHDRTRLTEFSDLIRPKGLKDVIIWMTYGWLAPKNEDDAYATFINNNMLKREAFGIVNSSFTFDATGQITINLSLVTKGVNEAQVALIKSDPDEKVFKDIKKIAETISEFRRIYLNAPVEGFGKDIRIYQILDFASAGNGQYPKDIGTANIKSSIKSLRDNLTNTKKISKSELDKFNKALSDYYDKTKNKYDFQDRVNKSVTNIISKKFEECAQGLDPFLPTNDKVDKKLIDSRLLNLCVDKNLLDKNIKEKFKLNKKIISFGKLFSTIIIPSLLNNNTAHEIQVYFYPLNEQCGPISLHSIAEFPINLPILIDQYKDEVIQRGGENITIEEFLQFVIQSQFLDNRALGYGLSQYYKPYDPSNHDPQTLEGNANKNKYETALSQMILEQGGQKLPNIEMNIEVVHRNDAINESSSKSDLLSQLDTSSRDTLRNSSAKADNKKSYTIMKIHIYDKQLNPYKEVGNLFRNGESGNSSQFAQVDSSGISDFVKNNGLTTNTVDLEVFKRYITAKSNNEYEVIGDGGYQTIRDHLLNTVPKFTFGTNGSTILAANLASSQDALLSTVNMLKNDTILNTVAPNGAGDYNLPVRVVPAKLSLTTLGCPLASMAQSYFVDFNTGTTLDNLYIVIGLNHNFSPGKFETAWSMGYADAYGQFQAAPDIQKMFEQTVSDLEIEKADQTEKDKLKKR